MKLEFFGPLGRVTGSATLLTSERLGVQILVDAGLQQGEGDVDPWNSGPLPFDASKLTHVILTHAHIDHCGLLPRLFMEGFTGRVLCTPETAALTRLLLADCARVSRLYTEADVRRVRFDEHDVRFGQHFPIARDVWVQFFRSAHILGAVSPRVCWGKRGPSQRSIVFSGDLGTNVDRHERFLFLRDRMSPPASDFAVVESTYGGRDRGCAREQCFIGRVEALRVELRAAIQKGGTILVPVFATERLQTMLLDLAYLCSIDEEIANTPVFVHTPLGRAISAIYARFVRAKNVSRSRDGSKVLHSRWLSHSAFERFGLDPTCIEDERRLEEALVAVLDPDADGSAALPFLRRTHRWVDRVPERTGGPRIVLASGGMLQGGPAVAYLPGVLADPASSLLLPGYAAPSTLAGKLFELTGLSRDDRTRLDRTLELSDGTRFASSQIRAHIAAVQGYSGHADQRGLLNWLVSEHAGRRSLAGETVFIQHGSDNARHTLREELLESAPDVEVICPTPDHSEFDLDESAAPTESTLRAQVAGLEARIALLEAERDR